MVRKQGNPDIDYNARTYAVDGVGKFRICCLDCTSPDDPLDECLECFGEFGILSTNATSNVWTTPAQHILDVDTYVPTVTTDPAGYQYLTGPNQTAGRYLTHVMPNFININMLYSLVLNRYWYFNPGFTLSGYYDIQYLDGNNVTKYVPVAIWFNGSGITCKSTSNAADFGTYQKQFEIQLRYSLARFTTPGNGATNTFWGTLGGNNNRIAYIPKFSDSSHMVEYEDTCPQSLAFGKDAGSVYGAFNGSDGWSVPGEFTWSVNP